MATLKYEMTLRQKAGFTEIGLKAAMIRSLKEIGGALLGFEYQSCCADSDISGDITQLSKCICMVSIPDMPFDSGASAYQIILGDLQEVADEKYPYFEIVSIPADKMVYM